jgi:hypothetical protein
MPFLFCYNIFRLNSKFLILFFRNINRPYKNSYCEWLTADSRDCTAFFYLCKLQHGSNAGEMSFECRPMTDRPLKLYP